MRLTDRRNLAAVPAEVSAGAKTARGEAQTVAAHTTF